MTATKERPILFSGPMIRAILDGSKTQTRRLIKPQPPDWIDALHGGEFRSRAPYELCCQETGCIYGYGFETEDQVWKCPYGKPGDCLWVRETHALTMDNARGWNESSPNGSWPIYAATDGEWEVDRWRPSIHMPRWASRITLEITDVRVQRVQEISREDAIAEGATSRDIGSGKGWSMDWSEVGSLSPYASGVTNRADPKPLTEYDVSLVTPWAAFGNYWISIYGPESWDANPWVWAYTLKRID